MSNKIFFIKRVLGAAFTLSLLFFGISAQAAFIDKMDIEITIKEDATVEVIEQIQYNFESKGAKGIIRKIPIKYIDDNGTNKRMRISDVNVTSKSGHKDFFKVKNDGKYVTIKTGINGIHVDNKKFYRISYTIKNAVEYLENKDRINLNIIGEHRFWDSVLTPDKKSVMNTNIYYIDSINIVNASVSAPVVKQAVCILKYGLLNAECDKGILDENIFTIMQQNVKRDKSVIIDIEIPTGIMQGPDLMDKFITNTINYGHLILPIVAIIFLLYIWVRFGRNAKGREVIVPYYDPPNNLSPAEVAFILNEDIKSSDVLALLIDLAVRGYIKIEKINDSSTSGEDDYLFIKTDKNIDDISYKDEWILYMSIFNFAKYGVAKMSNLPNNFHKNIGAIADIVKEDIVDKKHYVRSPATVRNNYAIASIPFMTVGIILMFMMQNTALGISMIITSILIMSFGLFMPRLTKKGILIKEHILGFKMYLETAEKDRINFHNMPSKNPKHFDRLLPYAMVLGVENAWAAQFKEMHKAEPMHYEGEENFVYVELLADDIDNFLKSLSKFIKSKTTKKNFEI